MVALPGPSGAAESTFLAAIGLINPPTAGRIIPGDEPTAALDSYRGRQVMEVFRQVAHEQASAVIVVTHDPRSLEVFDRTYETEAGQLRAAAQPRPAVARSQDLSFRK